MSAARIPPALAARPVLAELTSAAGPAPSPARHGLSPSMRRGPAWPATSWSAGPPSAETLSGNSWQS